MRSTTDRSVGLLDVIVITTNWSEYRFLKTREVVEGIDSLNLPANKKILSVDILPEGTIDVDRFVRNGWSVVSGPCAGRRGMVENQLRGLSHSEAEFVFMCEDDAPIIDFPPLEFLQEMFAHGVDWINFNAHLHDEPSPELVSHINRSLSYWRKREHVFYRKDQLLSDKWLLTFPAAIMRREVLIQLHEYAKAHCTGCSIEEGLSKAFRQVELGSVMVYLKRKILKRLGELSPDDFHRYANMRYWNNDVSTRHESINGKNGIWY